MASSSQQQQSSIRSRAPAATTTTDVDAMILARSSSRFVPVDVDGARQQLQEEEERMMELRRGPWTVDEDLALVNYITDHGEGRWNSLAQAAGLKRTGKSCRLRWLNYLRPDVKRGNFTADEQLLILDLHSRYGNRWSKIAQHLPGRTDNEIKNYWRTRVQKHAKQLNCDANSKRFKDAMRYLWMPHLVDVVEGHHRRRLLLHQDGGGGGYDVHPADLSMSAGGLGPAVMTSSSSGDSLATSDQSSYNDAHHHIPMKWEAAAATTTTCGDDDGAGLYANDVRAGEMLVDGGGAAADWVQLQETMNQAAGALWPAAEQKPQVVMNGGTGGGQFDDLELSGWVQSFSEGTTENFWTLDDIWKMQ